MSLPIRRITLYKHGVGHFERSGPVSGQSVELTFPATAMDDVLKSLVAVDRGAGRVLSVGFQTPEGRAVAAAHNRIQLSADRSLLDLLRDLRGSQVRIVGTDQQVLAGLLVGTDVSTGQPTRRALVTIYLPETGQVQTMPAGSIASLELVETRSQADLGHALALASGVDQQRSARIALTPGEHDLQVTYLAPAPAWRVSYRVIAEAVAPGNPGEALLTGWGIFDNQLEEDLHDVTVSLVAGMPISFRYRLHEPHIPERPEVGDLEPPVTEPIFFEAAGAAPPAAMRLLAAPAAAAKAAPALADMVEATAAAGATGDDRGALFAYRITEPVSVGRGESAMVPVLSQRIPAHHELLFNEAKLAEHPVASLRLTNTSGLTLERGPATVLIGDSYAGEAVLPFTTAGTEVVLPYAVELGVTVLPDSRTDRILHGISFRQDATIITEYLQTTTRYELRSTLSDSATVVVERDRVPGFELAPGPDPTSVSSRHWRWTVQCPPGELTELVVQEQQLQRRSVAVRTLTGRDLATLLASGGLAQNAARKLEEVLALYRHIDAAQAEQARASQRVAELAGQQEPIRGNLAALSAERAEGALRARYVSSLNRIQDQIDAADARQQELADQIRGWEQQIGELVAELARESATASEGGEGRPSD